MRFLDLSQVEAAELLGISERTFRRWRHRVQGFVAGACPGNEARTERTDHELHKPDRFTSSRHGGMQASAITPVSPGKRLSGPVQSDPPKPPLQPIAVSAIFLSVPAVHPDRARVRRSLPSGSSRVISGFRPLRRCPRRAMARRGSIASPGGCRPASADGAARSARDTMPSVAPAYPYSGPDTTHALPGGMSSRLFRHPSSTGPAGLRGTAEYRSSTPHDEAYVDRQHPRGRNPRGGPGR